MPDCVFSISIYLIYYVLHMVVIGAVINLDRACKVWNLKRGVSVADWGTFQDDMTDEPAPTADYYRQAAAEVRALAHAAQLPEVRRDLFELAERFDRMARYVSRRYPHRRGVLPPTGRPDDA